MTSIKHSDVKKELLKNPETLKAYEELEEEYQMINEMIRVRKAIGVTQSSIAKRMKTTVSAVSRLESLKDKNNHSPSLKTLKRYAHALGCVLQIKFVRKKTC